MRIFTASVVIMEFIVDAKSEEYRQYGLRDDAFYLGKEPCRVGVQAVSYTFPGGTCLMKSQGRKSKSRDLADTLIQAREAHQLRIVVLFGLISRVCDL